MLYLYTQPFTTDDQTPFWQTVASTLQHGAKDSLFLTATRGIQQHLKERLASWVSEDMVLPEILTLDDLVFAAQENFAHLGFSHIYLLEHLLSTPTYAPLCAQHPPAIVAQSLFETYEELQKHTITPAQLTKAMQQHHVPDHEIISNLFRDFVSTGKSWPFPSKYSAYAHATFKNPIWHNKTVFMLGFWELPAYQRPLVTQVIREANTVAIQLHYSPLSPVYEAAQPFYTWLRASAQSREIPFQGHPQRAPITVYACESPLAEVQWALTLAARKTQNLGILISESDPYHDLLHQQAPLLSNWETHPTIATGTMPLATFLMAFLDPELPNPAAMDRLMAHILVSQAVPDWHWPTFVSTHLDRMSHWQWGEWERVLQTNPIPKALLHLAQARKGQASDLFQVCVAATTLLGHPLDTWPAPLITGMTQACSLADRLGPGASRLRSIVKSMFGPTQTLPNAWPCYGKFESHLVQKKQWLLLGCRDGVWPKITRKTYALPGPVVRQLGLPSTAHYVRADSYFFHALLHQATDQVIAVYPKTHEDVPQALTHFLSGFPIHDVPTAATYRHNTALDPEPTPLQLPTNTMAQIDLQKFSPTRLERYQGCPYQYYLQHILKLPEDSPPLDVSPSALGELIHDVLQQVTSLEREQGHADLQMALARAMQKQQARYGINSLKSWLLSAKVPLLQGNAAMPGILPETLKALSEAQLPIHAIAEEVSLGQTAPLHFTVLNTDFALTGRIDAIYAIHDSDLCLIVDYKTGSKPYSKKDLETYRNLQLPLYMLMAQKAYPDKTIAGAAIVYARHRSPGIDIMAITTEGKKALELKRKRPLILDEMYHHETLFHTEQVVRSIREGHFGVQDVPIAAPFLSKRKDLCPNCHYRWLCDFPERWEGV